MSLILTSPSQRTTGARALDRRTTPGFQLDPRNLQEVLDDTWREYKQRGTLDARNRLILHYAPLVKVTVSRVWSGAPQHIEQAELLSYGIFGLMDAIDKFDPSRGVNFETYAPRRIKGAIMDELRSVDWVPRSIRSKASAVERAYSKLQGELRRSPEHAEVAAELGASKDELSRARTQIFCSSLLALDQLLALDDRDGSMTVGETVADHSHDPVESYELHETKRLLADAINRMPDRERLVLTLYYYEGLTQAEIGDALGVTESRVCQIRAKAVRRLQERASAWGLVDCEALPGFEIPALASA